MNNMNNMNNVNDIYSNDVFWKGWKDGYKDGFTNKIESNPKIVQLSLKREVKGGVEYLDFVTENTEHVQETLEKIVNEATESKKAWIFKKLRQEEEERIREREEEERIREEKREEKRERQRLIEKANVETGELRKLIGQKRKRIENMLADQDYQTQLTTYNNNKFRLQRYENIDADIRNIFTSRNIAFIQTTKKRFRFKFVSRLITTRIFVNVFEGKVNNNGKKNHRAKVNNTNKLGRTCKKMNNALRIDPNCKFIIYCTHLDPTNPANVDLIAEHKDLLEQGAIVVDNLQDLARQINFAL